jgi:hypothetical protein
VAGRLFDRVTLDEQVIIDSPIIRANSWVATGRERMESLTVSRGTNLLSDASFVVVHIYHRSF